MKESTDTLMSTLMSDVWSYYDNITSEHVVSYQWSGKPPDTHYYSPTRLILGRLIFIPYDVDYYILGFRSILSDVSTSYRKTISRKGFGEHLYRVDSGDWIHLSDRCTIVNETRGGRVIERQEPVFRKGILI